MINEYKKLRKQRKIEDFELKYEYVPPTPIQYKERQHYIFTMRYKRKYHFGEIFNCMFCQEKNKPSKEEINTFREKLSDYSMPAIYKASNYSQRKHLIYIYHMLNNLLLPQVTSELMQQKDLIGRNLNAFFARIGTNKSFKHRFVIDVICERFNFSEIRKYLCFKDNKKSWLTYSSWEKTFDVLNIRNRRTTE